MSLRYPCIGFDFDGTLVSSLEAAHRAFRCVAPDFGCDHLERAQLEQLRGLHAREVLQALGVPLYRAPELAMRMRRAMRAELMETPPVEGIGEALEALASQGHRLGVLSSNARESVLGYAARYRLPGLVFVQGGIGLFRKGAALRGLARAEGLPTSGLLYVGDELRDLEAARRARVAFAGVAWGFTPLEPLLAAGADFGLRHPRELLEMGRGGALRAARPATRD